LIEADELTRKGGRQASKEESDENARGVDQIQLWGGTKNSCPKVYSPFCTPVAQAARLLKRGTNEPLLYSVGTQCPGLQAQA
jgi:hypothetical protein